MREIIILIENPYYWTCEYCGANLDPGEKCDCDEARKEREKKKVIKENWDNHDMMRNRDYRADAMRGNTSLRSESPATLNKEEKRVYRPDPGKRSAKMLITRNKKFI